jgi:hypothetical protein
MTRNEKTSARVAKIAARILRANVQPNALGWFNRYNAAGVWIGEVELKWSDIHTLAVWCRMQAPDRKRAKKRKRSVAYQTWESNLGNFKVPKPISKLSPVGRKIKEKKARRF